jgi:hypothetical protein
MKKLGPLAVSSSFRSTYPLRKVFTKPTNLFICYARHSAIAERLTSTGQPSTSDV